MRSWNIFMRSMKMTNTKLLQAIRERCNSATLTLLDTYIEHEAIVKKRLITSRDAWKRRAKAMKSAYMKEGQ